MVESSETIGIHKVARPHHLTSGFTLGEKKIRLFFTLTTVIKLRESNGSGQ